MFKTVIAAALLMGSANVFAAGFLKGELCYSNWTLKGLGGDGQAPVLECKAPLGTLTVSQLYEKGWRVVTVERTNTGKDYYAVFVEEQSASK